MILSGIIEEKKRSISKAKEALPLDEILKHIALAQSCRRNFKLAISKHTDINLIAEIKKASPSRGVIRESFDPAQIAKIYQVSGASALSVLTEEKFFLGSLDYINSVKHVCSLPVLRKDFIIDEYQIYESVFFGADAILLIADLLSQEQIVNFRALALSFNMDSLVEVHTDEGIEKVLTTDADIIGINNRDLNTFKLSLKTSENLIKLIPKNKLIVIESGIKTNSDMMFLKSLGANAVLVGEAFMESDDIAAKVRSFLGK